MGPGAVFRCRPFTCAVLILVVTGLYVVAGGFHGIVRVEILQTIVLSAGAITFAVIGWQHFDSAKFAAQAPAGWFSILPSARPQELQGVVSGGTDFSFFGALVAVWLAKGLLLCLSGPEQLYDFQRFLAARDARDASKLGALWGVVHTVRWPFAMAIAVMAIMGPVTALDAALKRDPKRRCRSSSARLPHGPGFMLAALSGFLATFSSTVNGGAAYLVKDIFQRYVNPQASPRTLIRASYAASALLIVIGLVIARFGTSINTAFMGFSVPRASCRRTSWLGTGGGSRLGLCRGRFRRHGAVLGQVIGDHLWRAPPPLYGLPVIALASTFITIAVALLTTPAEATNLACFYRSVQPAAWRPCGEVSWPQTRRFAKTPALPEGLNMTLAVAAVCGLYVGTLYLITHRYTAMGLFFGQRRVAWSYFTCINICCPAYPATGKRIDCGRGKAGGCFRRARLNHGAAPGHWLAVRLTMT